MKNHTKSFPGNRPKMLNHLHREGAPALTPNSFDSSMKIIPRRNKPRLNDLTSKLLLDIGLEDDAAEHGGKRKGEVSFSSQ